MTPVGMGHSTWYSLAQAVRNQRCSQSVCLAALPRHLSIPLKKGTPWLIFRQMSFPITGSQLRNLDLLEKRRQNYMVKISPRSGFSLSFFFPLLSKLMKLNPTHYQGHQYFYPWKNNYFCLSSAFHDKFIISCAEKLCRGFFFTGQFPLWLAKVNLQLRQDEHHLTWQPKTASDSTLQGDLMCYWGVSTKSSKWRKKKREKKKLPRE